MVIKYKLSLCELCVTKNLKQKILTLLGMTKNVLVLMHSCPAIWHRL